MENDKKYEENLIEVINVWLRIRELSSSEISGTVRTCDLCGITKRVRNCHNDIEIGEIEKLELLENIAKKAALLFTEVSVLYRRRKLSSEMLVQWVRQPSENSDQTHSE